MRAACLAALTLLAGPVAAQEAGPCTGIASARNIAEPWEQNTATYAEGAVRLAVIDTLEPAGAPFHLLILSPPIQPPGERQCRLVSTGGMGWYSMDFEARSASYDAERGLTVTVPAQVYGADGPEPVGIAVTVDQGSGDVTVEQRPESGAE